MFTLSCLGQNPLQQFAPQVSRVLIDAHIPGLVIGLVQGDSTWVLPLGFRDPERSLPVTRNTPYYIASVTKVFTAQTVLQLVHDGMVELDAPVRKYLPRFTLADARVADSVTVRDLLCHKKGLESWPITFGEAFTGQMTDDRFYRALSLVETDGSFGYSNLHYTLLGRIIEAVTGSNWKANVDRAVFAKAGMLATTTSAASLNTLMAAVPTEFEEGTLRAVHIRKTDRTMHAAGGIVSTADDLLRWLRLHLNDGLDPQGTVFPTAVIRNIRENQLDIPNDHPFIADQKRIGWGLGWMIREHRGMRYIMHNGQFDGCAAHMSYLPERDLGLVILVNNKKAGMWLTEALAAQVYDHLLGMEPRDYLALVPEKFTKPADAPTPSASPHENGLEEQRWSEAVGTYVNADWGTLVVSLEGGRITMRIGDLPLPLVWIGASSFVAGGDHEGSFIATDGKISAIELGMPLPDLARFERLP